MAPVPLKVQDTDVQNWFYVSLKQDTKGLDWFYVSLANRQCTKIAKKKKNSLAHHKKNFITFKAI